MANRARALVTMRLNVMVMACLAVRAAALRPSLVSALWVRPLGGRAPRARRLVAQEQGLPAGWSAGFDETSGSHIAALG